MGLDSYFRKLCAPGQTAEIPDFGDDIPMLCGGLMSGSGSDGSFRGKVYADTIKEITGVDIYQEVIHPNEVKEMADALCKQVASMTEEERANDPNDLVALSRVFRAFADLNYSLLGWW